MDPFTLAILTLAGAAAAAGYAYTRKETPTAPAPGGLAPLIPSFLPPPALPSLPSLPTPLSPTPSSLIDRPSRFKGMLKRGQLYRVWARVDLALQSKIREATPQGMTSQQYLEAVLKQQIEAMGFAGTLLAVQDPTDSQVWTFITRWGLGSNEAFDTDAIRLYQLEPVDEPPVSVTMPKPDPLPTLDNGLAADEIHAVAYALAKDDDPKHLEGFATTMDGDFPIAASYLRAKGRLAALQNQNPAETSGEDSKIQERYEKALATVGWKRPEQKTQEPNAGGWGDAFEATGEALGGTVKALGGNVVDAWNQMKSWTSDLGSSVEDAWNKYGGVVETLGGSVPGPQIWIAETAIKAAKKISRGESISDAVPDVLSEQTVRFAKGLQVSDKFLALVPGVGTGVAMMIDAGAALALGQPLDQAVLSTIATAIPGGPVAQEGFLYSADVGSRLLRGESLDQAALEAARARIQPPELRAAFDAGLALAQGKSLQDAGFQVFYSWAKGNDLASRAAEFANVVVEAVNRGGTGIPSLVKGQIANILVERAYKDLLAVHDMPRMDVDTRLGNTISALMKDGELLKMYPNEIAQRLGVQEAVARAALLAVSEAQGGVRIVNPDIVKRLRPIVEPKLVALAAVKLAQAVRQPAASLVVNPSMLAQKLGSIRAAMGPENPPETQAQAKAAAESLARAQRLLERRRWVEWYRLIEEAENQSANVRGTLTGPL